MIRNLLRAAALWLAISTPALAQFYPAGNASLSVSNTSANVLLPTGGASVLIQNVGSAEAFVVFGVTNTTTAVAADSTSFSIPPGISVTLPKGAATYIAAITAASTTTLRISAGTGIPNGWGGPANTTAAVTGSTSNASSGVATGSTNVPSVAYNYGFNGTTWDQLQVDANKNLKVALSGTQANVPVQGVANITPTDCSGTITSGGTAQNAHTAQSTLRGMTIANIDTTEVLWFSFTGTAAASGTGSFPLAPATATTFASLSSYTTPVGFGYNTALSVIAATTSHKFTCTRW